MNKSVCSQCGAPVMSDSKFCSHCGAKIDDGVERKEIVIDNKAEVMRAGYETKESDVRQKKEKIELVKFKATWILIGILSLFSVAMFIWGVVGSNSKQSGAGLAIFYGLGGLTICIILTIKNLFRK